MPGDSGVLVVTRVLSTNTKCTRGRGCSGHPAFPDLIRASINLRKKILSKKDGLPGHLARRRASRFRPVTTISIGMTVFAPRNDEKFVAPSWLTGRGSRAENVSGLAP